ncbi:MAG: efflux RND transporter periplasmic adaptor subunit [Spirochaetia bacterium]|nr:efflux RND transporter periplasmic adaptor subunit [Spirochaetia bacterium]
MNNNRILAMLAVLAVVGVAYYGVTRTSKGPGSAKTTSADPTKPEIGYWTCSMHRQIHLDGPGECPICHMKLVPVYLKSGVESLGQDSIQRERGSYVEIDPQVQTQVGIRTIKVSRSPFIVTLRTNGKVALDPDLATAVREFIEVGRLDRSMYQASVNRLRLLGMGNEEIRAIDSNPQGAEAMYRPAGGVTWVYATLYENELRLVHAGQAVTVTPSYDEGKSFSGIVRSISPIVDSSSRSVRARIKVNDSQTIRPDAFVRVSIPVNLGQQLVIPRSALVDVGEKKIVFVAEGDNRFVRREVQVSEESREQFAIRSGLKEGERIVSTGTFMIDSESRLSESAAGGQ